MSAGLYTEDQVQQKINEFKISDLYQRLEILERELRNDIKTLDTKLDTKIHGLYQLIIGAISVPVFLFMVNFLWGK